MKKNESKKGTLEPNDRLKTVSLQTVDNGPSTPKKKKAPLYQNPVEKGLGQLLSLAEASIGGKYHIRFFATLAGYKAPVVKLPEVWAELVNLDDDDIMEIEIRVVGRREPHENDEGSDEE